MPLLAVGAGMSILSSGFGMYQGMKQEKEGKKALANMNKPTYEIPQELYDNLSDAEKMEVEGLPAAQKKQFVQNVQRAQQSALKAQADRKGGLMGLQSAMQAETDAYTNLMSMDAAAQKESELRKQSMVQQARGAIAGAKDRQYQEQMGDYQQGVQSAQGMIGAGKQNFMQGLQGIGSGMLQIGAATYGGGNRGTGTGSGEVEGVNG